MLTVLVAQVFRIQGIDAAAVSAQALDSRLQHVTIPAMRGTITDSTGTVLASSVERRNVTADATTTVDYTKKVNGKKTKVGLAGAAADIAPIVGADKADLLATLTKANKAHSRFTYLIKDISPDQWRQINTLNIPGIYSETVVKRLYPQGTSVAPIVGWVGANGQPGGGVELMEQNTLKGTPGLHVYEQAPDGTMIATGDNKDTPAKAGSNVSLTLDNNIQWYAANVLAQTTKKWGAASADAVVIDVKTGELKAVASYPSFDNNTLSMASAAAMQSQPFTYAYEPGSTNKAITISAALAQKLITPTSQFVVPNRLPRADEKFKDSHDHATEYLTTEGVVAQSSNIGTIEIGEKMSAQTLYDYIAKFGLTKATGIGFPGESGGITPPVSKWTGSTRYTMMFGQGLAATAVQQAGVFQTIANGGVRTPLKLIRGIDTGNGWQAPTDTRTATRVVPASVATQMTQMMEGVVSKKGTAPLAAVSGYKVAGKTGTAENWDAKKGGYNGYTASFVGFAPADKPAYVVLIAVHNPTKGSIYGGDISAPAFSELMSYVLQYEKVPPTGPQPTDFNFTFTPSATEGRRQ